MTKVARHMAKRQKRQREKHQKELDRLAMERNKALKEAKANLALAKAREDALDAKTKAQEAKARRGRVSKSRLQTNAEGLMGDVKKGASSLFKDIKRNVMPPKKKRKTLARRHSILI